MKEEEDDLKYGKKDSHSIKKSGKGRKLEDSSEEIDSKKVGRDEEENSEEYEDEKKKKSKKHRKAAKEADKREI